MSSRTLFFDIETSPILAYVWQAKTDYVNHNAITHETFLISWAAKWEDGRKVMGDVLTADEAVGKDDSRIVEGLAELIREADTIVAHNGDRFDIPIVNARLLLLGHEPLPPVQTIDTLTLARKNFRLFSSRLDHIAKVLGHDGKISTSFDLWLDCYAGDPKALSKMLRYNKRDVILLQDVYESLRPYLRVAPSLLANGRCVPCGSTALQKRGFHRTRVNVYQRYQCQGCGRWGRDTKPIKKVWQ